MSLTTPTPFRNAVLDESKMRVKIHKQESPSEFRAGEVLEFTVENVDSSFANGLRRVMLAEIPTLAVERVDVRINTSVYHDEFLVHRLALVPIRSEKAAEMCYTKDCVCGGAGCDACQVVMELRVRCESDQHSRKVYSSDIVSQAPGVTPVASTKGIWLLTLGRSQEIDMRCYVRKGIAKVHAKYMPVATVAMSYASDIKLNEAALGRLEDAHRQQFVNRCPRKVFRYNQEHKTVEVGNRNDCIYCDECLNTDPPFDQGTYVTVRQKKNQFGLYECRFRVESTGVLPVLDIVRMAVGVMVEKLIKVRQSLQDHDKAMARGSGAQPQAATRPIGIAPTAIHVLNEDVALRGTEEEDDLHYVMQ